MKKIIIIVLLISIFPKNTYSQSFDTLNLIDNFSRYIIFIDTADIKQVCATFKKSRYFDSENNRKEFYKYPIYTMNNEYYKKYKISKISFVTIFESYPERDFLQMLSFEYLAIDSNYISNKLLNNGWKKESCYSIGTKGFKRYLYRKKINGIDYIIYNTSVITNEKKLVCSITIHDEIFINEKIENIRKKAAIDSEIKDSLSSLIPIDSIKEIYYAKTEDDIPISYNGIWEYFKAGKIFLKVIYKNGEINGESIEYYKNGQIKIKMSFIEGKLNGEILSYYEDGKLHERMFYKNSQIDGLRQIYWENGKLQTEIYYANNKIEGEEKQYYEKGNLHLIIRFKNDIPQEEIIYSDNGNIILKGNYVNGREDGEWLQYDESGTILKRRNFKNGEELFELEK